MTHNFTTHPFDGDTLHEECGVFAILGHPEASAHTVLGLHALQHRGQEGAGIVSCDGDRFYQHLAFGKVGDNFSSEEVVGSLKGRNAIGHNRYSTSGQKKMIHNIQPLFAELNSGGLALAHNGNLTNAQTLRKKLVGQGTIFRTTMDTEVVMHMIAMSKEATMIDRVTDALKQVQGGFSMVVMDSESIIGVRDPHGVRPLLIGKYDGAYILTSETCALDIIGARLVREVEPGEMIILRAGQEPESFKPFEAVPSRFCIFEYVYFARPDSFVAGKDVYALRKAMGRELAQENPVEADIVVPVPDSGVPAAIGYGEAAGIPFELGIIRNHYVGRTFIEPTDHIRHLGVRLKHNANQAVLEGKRVVLVDDSLVRGTTSKKIVAMVKNAGAKEVHLRISSPPTSDPCFYGVDTPSKDNLLASKMSVEDMAAFVEADSLSFLSVNSLYRAVGEIDRNAASPQYCDACFTGEYPIDVVDRDGGDTPLLSTTSAA